MKILINAAGETIIDEVNYPDRVGLLAGSKIQLDLGDQGSNTATAGTLTFECASSGGSAYSIPENGNSIDCSAPLPLTITDNLVGSIKCTATGVSGGVGGKIALVVLGFS
jgi:hypothetical protein